MSGAIQSKRAGSGCPRPRAQYPKPASLAELTASLYNHVLEAIDFGALYTFEQLLWSLLPEQGVDDEDGEIASTMIRDAIIKAASDPMRNVSTVPYGVTKEEEKAVAFDENCFFCVYEAANPSEDDTYQDGECGCCDAMARDWREEHAHVLSRRGVRPPAHNGPGPTMS